MDDFVSRVVVARLFPAWPRGGRAQDALLHTNNGAPGRIERKTAATAHPAGRRRAERVRSAPGN